MTFCVLCYDVIMSYDMILRDRPYYDQILDLDKSKGDTPTNLINQFRYIRLCGLLFEQISCDTLTAMASFKQIDKQI